MTDGRTDRRTERILLAIPRLHYVQRFKNELSVSRLSEVAASQDSHTTATEDITTPHSQGGNYFLTYKIDFD